MNYPIWEITGINHGTLIALISVLHAYIAHLAVGGGIFLWLTDLKGFRENKPEIHSYIRRYTWFFLLVTMVFGGVTGVGIWFVILLITPSATSTLIHNFVFGWAIEWVFFLGEITALLIYHAGFHLLKPRHRLNIAFFYALFAWLSMVVINGILSFMLTPGKWILTQNFWDGFFNPTFWPSLLFRTSAALMIAGIFGELTSVFSRPGALRDTMMRYCAKWLVFPAFGLIIFGLWYYYSIPVSIRATAFHLNAQTVLPFNIFAITSFILFAGGIFFLFRSERPAQGVIVIVLAFIGLGWYGGFEYMREYARKPYLIYGYMYSNSILKGDVETLNREGVLKNARWSSVREVTDDNTIEAGREIFNLECAICHSTGGINNDIIKKTKNLTYMGMLSQLKGQGKVLDYMPEFIGTEREREALATYITVGLQDREIITEPAAYNPVAEENDIPAFDGTGDEYVLLAWNDLGMHCISDGDPWFLLLPPANTLEAQLIRRGTTPELVSEGVDLTYCVEKGYENPSKHVGFWDYVKYYFGKDLDTDVGLAGNGLEGSFRFESTRNGFIAEMIPVTPYRDDGTYNPYPQFHIEAKDKATGEVLASTKAVAPVSTEMGCRNCHGGGWRVDNTSGIADETAINILKTHDRISGTDLYASATAGTPQLCQNCHADPAIGASGKSGHNNLSTSMHGWHANYMYKEGGKACAMCHPASDNGNTRCSRGVHAQVGLECIDCHGTLNEHAASLLKNQMQNNSASRLIANLTTVNVSDISEANPRTPWIQEPDCITCHANFREPSVSVSYNKWNDAFSQLYRTRTDETGMRCIACHNSTHSEYPSVNVYGENRDNTQPMQYMGTNLPIGSESSCSVCHTKDMDASGHHPNMVRAFRNESLIEKR